jgi:hypothetical protein
MKSTLLSIVVCVSACVIKGVSAGERVKHRFVATDESRKQLIYVDEFDSSKSWAIPLKGNRDLQVIESGRCLVSVPTGYREYEITTGKMIKEVTVGKNICSLFRTKEGHTFLANRESIYELDAKDKIIKVLHVKMGGAFRVLRQSSDGGFLFSGGKTLIKQANPNGHIEKTFDVTTLAPGTAKPYLAKPMPNGNLMISMCFGATLLELDKDWKLVRKIGGKGSDLGAKLMYFCDAQVLKNGNVAVANWTGHGANDSKKAPQILEFNKTGKVVWTWHDPKFAGSIHGVVIIE